VSEYTVLAWIKFRTLPWDPQNKGFFGDQTFLEMEGHFACSLTTKKKLVCKSERGSSSSNKLELNVSSSSFSIQEEHWYIFALQSD